MKTRIYATPVVKGLTFKALEYYYTKQETKAALDGLTL